MRSTKSIILIVIALGCGLVASIGISQVMENRTNSGGPIETEAIYVAATNVPSYVALTTQLVQVEEWPKDKIPQGAARSLEEFEGMRPRVPLYPGEPIMMSKLSDGMSGIASERIPEGMQVFAVKVDKESALSGLILPGDRVDVLVFIRGSGSARERIRTGTRTILRNVSVFAVNDQIGRNVDEGGMSIDAKTVSLLVKPEQSEKLLLAKQLGTIHLALRKPGDETTVATRGASPHDLDEEDDETAGSFAQADQSNQTNGIFDILKSMKAGPGVGVDTSSAATAEMVIMSPRGVLQSYSWATTGGLPRELSGGTRGVGGLPTHTDKAITDKAITDKTTTDSSRTETSSSSGDDEQGDVEVDAADLGL